MCNPVAVMAVMAVTSAVVQKTNSDTMARNQAKAIKDNALATYAANQETARQAAKQAFEQQTDRARSASQQLAQARVLAAQGGGSLAARAFNIQSGEAEDFARIDASLSNQLGSLRQADANVALMTSDKISAVNDQFHANQVKFFSDIGSAAASAYGMSAKSKADEIAALGLDSSADVEAELEASRARRATGIPSFMRAPGS